MPDSTKELFKRVIWVVNNRTDDKADASNHEPIGDFTVKNDIRGTLSREALTRLVFQGVNAEYNTTFSGTVAPSKEAIDKALGQFALASDDGKMRLLQIVVNAANIDKDMAIQFYNALSNDQKDQFAHEVWNASDKTTNDSNFGGNKIIEDILGALPKAAIHAIVGKLPVLAPTV
jgi:hypothetical protein